jgi:5-methyltetrahydrofolate--homocysteine methyltransferase
MLYKEDWEKVRQRMLAWWQGEILDRVALQVDAPRDNARPHNWDPFYLARHLDEPERAFTEWENYCRATFFGGEFVPNLWANLGPGIPAAYLGATPHVVEDTVWFEPPRELSLEKIATLEFDKNNYWWEKTKELTVLAAEAGKGKFFAGLTDLNSVFDIIGHLRGTQNLLCDLMDRPEVVKKATTLVNDIWLACYDELSGITGRFQEGTVGWMNIWFPGRGCEVQCDFSYMISPAMFEEFVLPHLAEECRHLDQSIYHLDGPGELPHLEMLLDIPELDGIQWVPGVGNPGTGSPSWFAMYRRIQEKGKLLVLQGMDKPDVEGVLEAISSRGLLIETKCDSEPEARELLKKAEKWTRE